MPRKLASYAAVRSSLVALVFVVAVAAQDAGVSPVQKAAAITITASVNLKTDAANVWASVTSMKGLTVITGISIDAADHGKSFSKLGDSASAQMRGDRGRLIVTFINADKELRVCFEPDSAGYLCHKRVILGPADGRMLGTKLEYTNRYTDDQPNADDTASRVRDDTIKAIDAFRTLVEK